MQPENIATKREPMFKIKNKTKPIKAKKIMFKV